MNVNIDYDYNNNTAIIGYVLRYYFSKHARLTYHTPINCERKIIDIFVDCIGKVPMLWKTNKTPDTVTYLCMQ